MISEEIESDLQSYDEDEVPFARHGPVLEADFEEVAIQRDFGVCVQSGSFLTTGSFQ